MTEGGSLELFGQCPFRTNTFQKGASLCSYELISTSIGNIEIPQVVLTVRGLTVENDPTTDYSKEQEGADR